MCDETCKCNKDWVSRSAYEALKEEHKKNIHDILLAIRLNTNKLEETIDWYTDFYSEAI